MILQINDHGPEVQKLQSELALLVPGAEMLVVDGRFGPDTYRMVKEFQLNNKLSVDGIVGPNTFKALELAMAKQSDSVLHVLALKLRRLFGKLPTGLEKFEFDTKGPADDEHPLVPVGTTIQLNQGQFVNGWWSEATKWTMNPGRVGPAITPKSVVVHTTDTQPGAMGAVLRSWKENAGNGSGAHFLIGKMPQVNKDDISGGIFQMVPISRNGNHAGGFPGHGWFKTAAGALIHPNTCTVGIEIDNAGLLKKINGKWIHVDSKREILNVVTDAKGRGWEKLTDYQMLALDALLKALDLVMPRFEPGVTVVPNGTYVANGMSPEAATPSVRFVGHFSLDPARKTDCGPFVMDYLRGLKV